MAYGSEAHADFVMYEIVVDHAGTGIRANIRVDMGLIVGGTAPEGQRDAVFQAFLTRVAGMPGASIVSSTKMGSFTQSVTA